jgi:hypothetical protein
VNGGQDWNTGANASPKCGNGMAQSPINVPEQLVTYGVSTLKPLNVSYGETSDWMLEVTGARTRTGRASAAACAAAACAAATAAAWSKAHSRPSAANYLEIADIDTNTTGVDVATANTFTDGLTLASGTFVPLNQVRLPIKPNPLASSADAQPRAQFHFHTPSEHTINGMHFPLEMHMVHKLFINTTTNQRIPASACPSSATQCSNSVAAVISIMFAYRCVPA